MCNVALHNRSIVIYAARIVIPLAFLIHCLYGLALNEKHTKYQVSGNGFMAELYAQSSLWDIPISGHKPVINIVDGINIVCSIGVIHLKNVTPGVQNDIDISFEVRAPGIDTTWIPISKTIRTETDLYYSDVRSGSDWLGKVIQIRPYFYYYWNYEGYYDKIIGDPVSMIFLPVMQVTYRGIPPSCNGSDDGQIELTFPDRNPIASDTARIRVSIKKYDLHKLRDVGDGYLPKYFPPDTTPYYFYDQITFTASVPGNKLIITPQSITDSRFHLSAGKYEVTAQYEDAPGCAASSLFSLSEPPLLTGKAQPVNAWKYNGTEYHIRTGETTGSVRISCAGGTLPYYYKAGSLSGFVKITGSSVIISLPAGTGSYYIKDANGCSTGGSITLNKPADLQIKNLSADPVPCNRLDHGEHGYGQIHFSLQEGIPFYTAKLYNGSTLIYVKYHLVPGEPYTFTGKNIIAGNYTVQVTDTSVNSTNPFIVKSSIIPVSEPSRLVLNTNTVPAKCPEDFVELDVSGTGGNGPYRYALNLENYGYTPRFMVQGGQTDTVFLKDQNGCSTSRTVFLPSPPVPLGLAFDITDVSCEDADNGGARIIPAGGTPYRGSAYDLYVAGHGSMARCDTLAVEDLGTGYYQVILKDSNACTLTGTFTVGIVDRRLGFSSVIAQEPSCRTASDGRIMVKIEPGERAFPDYTYWLYKTGTGVVEAFENAGDSVTFNSLRFGTYSLILEDKAGCRFQDSLCLKISPDSLRLLPEEITPTICPGTATGSVIVHAQKGCSADGTYLFTLFALDNTLVNEQEGAQGTFPNLAEGTYRTKVLDDAGCVADKIITMPAKPSPVHFNLLNLQDQLCAGVENGEFALRGISLPGNGEISFSSDSMQNVLSGDTLFCSHLGAGSYRIIATDEAGCKSDTTVRIRNFGNEPVPFVILMDSTACRTAENGRLLIGVSQKIMNHRYQYRLCSAAGFVRTGSSGDTVRVYHLPSGNYMLNINDADGCAIDTAIDLVSKRDTVRVSMWSVDSSSCQRSRNGAISLTAIGGLPFEKGYLYCLNDSDSVCSDKACFTRLVPGLQYTIKVKDSAGCSVLPYYFTIPVKRDTLSLRIDQWHDASCPGIADGLAKATAVHGVPSSGGFLFQLIKKEGNDSTPAYKMSRQAIRFDTLGAGLYRINVSDTTGCQAAVSFRINEPDSLQASVAQNYIRHKGTAEGEISAQITGGNKKYYFEWYNGNDTAYGTRLKQGVTGYETGIGHLYAGSYLFRTRDTAGCLYNGKQWMEYPVEIREPEQPLELSVLQCRPVSCNGMSDGLIRIEGSGGWGDQYRYGRDSFHFMEPNLFTGLSPGRYRFYVSDTAGVVASIDTLVLQPEKLTSFVDSVIDPGCHGSSDGAVRMNIAGGTYPYYLSKDQHIWQKGCMLEHSPAGKFAVYIRDSMGCTSGPHAVHLNEPDSIRAGSFFVRNSRCLQNTGSIVVNITGGFPDYAYAWKKDNLPLQGDSGLYDIPAGRYVLTVTDSHLCTGTAFFNVSDESDLAIGNLQVFPVSCKGYSDGEAIVEIEGGRPPYSVVWTGGQTGMEATGLPAGEYTVAIADSENCRLYRDFYMPEPDSLYLPDVVIQSPLCEGREDGSVSVTVEGGTPAYHCLWSTGSTGRSIGNLGSGNYYLTVTDARRCINIFWFELVYQRNSTPYLGEDEALCQGSTIWLDPGEYYTYQWEDETGFISGGRYLGLSEPGQVFLTVWDEDGCTGRDTFRLEQSGQVYRASFLAASNLSAGDTLVLIETSWPVPDSVRWSLPTVPCIGGGEYLKELIFPDTGTFGIIMTGYYHGCLDAVRKQVKVTANGGENRNKKSRNMAQISRVCVRPNPNAGSFVVDIELFGVAGVSLRLIHVPTSAVRAIKKLEGSGTYSVLFNVPGLSPGLYVLQVICRNEMQSIPLVIE